MEDMEWCYYVADGGGKVYFDPAHTIIHHRGSSTEIYFGENLNPTIKSNFIDLVKRHKGVVYATIFFGLLKLNASVSSIMKSMFGKSAVVNK